MARTLRPEAELLLLCSSPVRNGETDAEILALLDAGDGKLDWKRCLGMAREHRLTPLLYQTLTTLRPAAVSGELEAAFRSNLKNSLLLTRDLIVLLDQLSRAGVPAVPFKGPTLASMAYEDAALRGFRDLDILIRREDVWRVRDALVALGYRSPLQLSARREHAYLGAYDELVVSGPGGHPLVELHWAFAPPHFRFDFDIRDCWPRRREIPVGERNVWSLDPEDTLLVLCVHGAKHCWSQLGQICDVAWLITRHPPKWRDFLERARKLGVHRIVVVAAALAAELFDVPIDEHVAEALGQDPETGRLAGEIEATLFGKGHNEASISANVRLHLRFRERFRDRLTYGCRLLFRPGIEDWQMVDLPGYLAFVYPLLRFPRLAQKYGLRMWRKTI